MTKQRVRPPKEIKELVLAEFNHRCALCGEDRPQIHHIDENPSNNVETNLLPLCPNHHLSDQHDPTRKFDPTLLALFRKYKDPQMLSPRFLPIFKRLKRLLEQSPEDDFTSLASHANDLINFMSHFALGDYYRSRLHNLLWGHHPTLINNGERDSAYAKHLIEYQEKLRQHMPEVIELLVEQLRYQDWPSVNA